MAEDDDFGLPREILTQVRKKASGYKPRTGGKTVQQYENTLKYENCLRLAEVRANCKDIPDEEAIKIVCSAVGRNYREFASKMALYNRVRTMEIEGKLEIAESKVATSEALTERVLVRMDRADERHEQTARENREFMHAIVGRIENLSIDPSPILKKITTDAKPNGLDSPNGSAV